MKNIFFALTYYHIMFAIMYSKKITGPSELYIIKDYLEFDNGFIERLKKLNVFDNVVLIEENSIKNKLAKINKEEILEQLNDNEIAQKFDEIIIPFYSYLDYKNINFYIFNTKTYIYYYAYKNNASITYIEDGYKSVFKNQNTFIYRGKCRFLNKYINNGYINLSLDDNHIKKIIGAPLPELQNKNIVNKYLEIDFTELFNENYQKNHELFDYLFQFNFPNIKEKSCLLLTQPLNRYKYCTLINQYLLFNKMIKNALKTCDHVYIKIHPADTNIYFYKSNPKITVLKGNYPVELLSINTNKFKKIMTFDSTSLDSFDDNIEKVSILDIEDRTVDNVKAFIKDYVNGERIGFINHIRLSLKKKQQRRKNKTK